MRIESVARIQAVRLAVTVGAVIAAPVLFVAGTPLRRRMLRRYYREDGSGLVSKEDGWVTRGTSSSPTWLFEPSAGRRSTYSDGFVLPDQDSHRAAVRSTRLRRSGSLARPNIWRLTILMWLTRPPTGPEFQ